MTNAGLNDIKQFLETYIAKENSMLELKIQHEMPAMKNFLANYSVAENNAQLLIENEAPKFNLFSILQVYHLEARVHTPFLVELLNPEGKHRQGRLFFNAFLRHLYGNSFNLDSIGDIKIAKEYADYNNGRMDILITFFHAGIPKAIVIENKIYHHDEKDQLTRYHRHLTQTRRLKQGQYHIIYLTPYKSRPSSDSISMDLYSCLISEKALTEWGYYGDIETILKSTLTEIKAPVVKHSITQYIDAIQFL